MPILDICLYEQKQKGFHWTPSKVCNFINLLKIILSLSTDLAKKLMTKTQFAIGHGATIYQFSVLH
jgi:hypothetical protein